MDTFSVIITTTKKSVSARKVLRPCGFWGQQGRGQFNVALNPCSLSTH